MLALTEAGQGAFYLLVAMAAVSGLLLLRSHRRMKQNARAAASPQPISSPPRRNVGHHLDAPVEIQRWEVALEERAREWSARLDNKMSALEHLLRAAGEAADRLERAIQASRAASHAPIAQPVAQRATVSMALPPIPVADAPVETQVAERARPEPPRRPTIEKPVARNSAIDRDMAAPRIGTPAAATTVRTPIGEAPPQAAGPHSFSKLRYEQVRALAATGLDAETIAARIGANRGEVELIMRLRQN